MKLTAVKISHIPLIILALGALCRDLAALVPPGPGIGQPAGYSEYFARLNKVYR